MLIFENVFCVIVLHFVNAQAEKLRRLEPFTVRSASVFLSFALQKTLASFHFLHPLQVKNKPPHWKGGSQVSAGYTLSLKTMRQSVCCFSSVGRSSKAK